MPKLKYETDEGLIGLTQVGRKLSGPTVAGVEPAGQAETGVYFRKSGSRRQAGIQVRYLVLSVNDGPLTPGGQQPKRYRRATVLTPVAFEGHSENDLLEIDGVQWNIDAKRGEG